MTRTSTQKTNGGAKHLPAVINGADEDDERTPTDKANARDAAVVKWADDTLAALGITAQIKAAATVERLGRIKLNLEDAGVDLAIRDALHPSRGKKAEHFHGLKEGSLKRILKTRFAAAKKEREDYLKKHPGSAAKARAADPNAWVDDLIRDDNDAVRPLVANLILYLQHDKAWRGALAFDEFKQSIILRKQPPWPWSEQLNSAWTDRDDIHTRVWFQRNDIRPTITDVRGAVITAARAASFHPVRDTLNSFTWDGTPRLDKWLTTYLLVDDTEYTRAVGRCWLISAVARIYRPGCKVDHMPVLEGPQKQLKSTALRKLALRDAWFTDNASRVGTKDSKLEQAGIWIHEIAELDALTRASTSTIKSHITAQSDRFRPPYAIHVIDVPRQSMFCGSVNPPIGGYLKDATGGRRFWPITIKGRIDIQALARDREQLWAEAIHAYRLACPTDDAEPAEYAWWFTPELEALAEIEQAARYKCDPWTDNVVNWVAKHAAEAGTKITVQEVLIGALELSKASQQSGSAEERIGKILTAMGCFTRERPRTKDGPRTRVYVRN